MTPKAPKYLKLSALLFFIAIVISGYMVWHHYALINGDAGFESFCSINSRVDCDVVNTSEYSELWGIPLATWALAYYIFGFLLSILGARSVLRRQDSLALLVPFGGVSVLVSLATFGITAFVLKTFCLMCASLQVLNIATFALIVLAYRDFFSGRNTGGKETQKIHPKKLTVYFGTYLFILLVTQGLSSLLKKEIPLETTAFKNELSSKPVLDVPVGDSPRLGFQGENPPIRLVEFADFQCPACGMAAKHMHRLLKVYGNKVQLVFKHFPFDSTCNPHVQTRMHDQACLAAKAAHCAHKQGKFSDFYQTLFTNQRILGAEQIRIWAKEAGLNLEELETCIASSDTSLAIQKDADLAVSLGLTSTPTFFVNGKKVEGLIDEQRLKVLIQELGK